MSEELRLRREAFAEGLTSYLLGLALRECPYPVKSARRAAWLEGWGLAEQMDDSEGPMSAAAQ